MISLRHRALAVFNVFFALGLFLFFVHRVGPPVVPTVAEPVYSGHAGKKEIALTFNVFWGEEYIPGILDILKENNVQATFFLGGQWTEQYPVLARLIADSGQEIESHGYSHPHADHLSESANLAEIEKAEKVIVKYTGKKPTLFAPPYGERGPAVLRAAERAGYRTVLWSTDTVDWQLPDSSVIVRRVMQGARPGGIVLMHPTAPTLHALPTIIAELKRQGYRLVDLDTLLREGS
ncbi:MAG: polysaccharide deacetylase family protein [Peptococcaceae bacterium]|nr:polysaccharide deacetylase family protein [Peptococcaceae bacterium]